MLIVNGATRRQSLRGTKCLAWITNHRRFKAQQTVQMPGMHNRRFKAGIASSPRPRPRTHACRRASFQLELTHFPARIMPMTGCNAL